MGKFVYGERGNITLDMHDGVLRAVQEALLSRVARGEVLYAAFTGEQDGQLVTSSLVISAGIPLMFFYDAERLPELNEDLVEKFHSLIDHFGGLDLSGLNTPAAS